MSRPTLFKRDRLITTTIKELFVHKVDKSEWPHRLIRESFQLEMLNDLTKKVYISSGLGGAFSLDFLGKDEKGHLFFRATNPGWTHFVYMVRLE